MKKAFIGVDIIEIDRVHNAITRWGEHFLHRVYTECELELYRNKYESLAVRFAGKEAIMKALNTPGVSISWKDVEILSASDGKPLVILNGRALEIAKKLGLRDLEISLSHSRQNAIAFIIGINE
jgi:holo-[acyl-carrier protein] synthase